MSCKKSIYLTIEYGLYEIKQSASTKKLFDIKIHKCYNFICKIKDDVMLILVVKIGHRQEVHRE